MKIVVTNTVVLNGGDAAILIAVIQLLQEAFGTDIEVTVMDSSPQVAKRHYPNLKFQPLAYNLINDRHSGRVVRKLMRELGFRRIPFAFQLWNAGWRWLGRLLLSNEEREVLRTYAAADLVVSTGGTYLVEHYSLAPRLLEFEMAQALSKPLVLFTQSMGPFRSARWQGALKRTFEYSRLVLVRDEQSERNLREIAPAAPNVRVAADAVFALSDPRPLAEFAPVHRTAAERVRVGVSVREWRHFSSARGRNGMLEYELAVAGMVAALVANHAAEVVFVSSCQGISEYQYDDSVVAGRIYDRLPEEVKAFVSVDSAFHSPDELIALLRQFDFVVATRMHIAILSLVAGVPVLPIVYEFKTRELFERLGMHRWIHDIETVSSDTLASSAGAFLEALASVRCDLEQGVRDACLDARSTAAAVREAIVVSPRQRTSDAV